MWTHYSVHESHKRYIPQAREKASHKLRYGKQALSATLQRQCDNIGNAFSLFTAQQNNVELTFITRSQKQGKKEGLRQNCKICHFFDRILFYLH